jgi:hypothetical protein
MRRESLLLILLGLVLFVPACKDSAGPSGPTPVNPQPSPPASMVVVLPETVVSGRSFALSVSALRADGTPATQWSGRANLSTSAGTLSQSYVDLSAGTATVQVSLSGAAGAVRITVQVGIASGQASTILLSGEPAVRLEIVPGGFLLPRPGASLRLQARALDSAGRPTTAEVTWQSSAPGTMSVGADGVVTAHRDLGSARITAHAQSLSSAPVVGLIAEPVAGVVLVADSQVVAGSLSLVDAGAEYRLGLRYRVRLRGLMPQVGQVLMATGEAPVAGRVVEASNTGQETVVTLEVISADALFRRLDVNESFALTNAPIVVPAATRSAYDVQYLPAGGLRFSTRFGSPVQLNSFSGNSPASEFDLGPFKCEAKNVVGGSGILSLANSSFEVRPDLRLDLVVQGVELRRFIVRGTIETRSSFRSALDIVMDGSVECKIEAYAIHLPIAGALSWLVSGYVPLGIGFAVNGKVDAGGLGVEATQFTRVNLAVGPECTTGCRLVRDLTTETEASFRPVVPDLQGLQRITAGISGFGYAELELAAPIARWLQDRHLAVTLLEARFGARQELALATPLVQANDPGYSSEAVLSWVIEAESSAELGRAAELLRISLAAFSFELTGRLATSPKGRLQITPAIVRPGDGTGPGELARFTVTLDTVDYVGTYAVDRVEIRWRRSDGNGGFTLEPGRPACSTLAATPGQRVFICETNFLLPHGGDQTFFAFVYPRLFGVSLPLPFEVGRDGRATVHVSRVASVEVAPSSVSVPVGGTRQLTATVRAADGEILAGRTISWQSSNTAIATVSTNGLVSGIAAGQATITATSEGRSGEAALTVAASVHRCLLAYVPDNSGMTQMEASLRAGGCETVEYDPERDGFTSQQMSGARLVMVKHLGQTCCTPQPLISPSQAQAYANFVSNGGTLYLSSRAYDFQHLNALLGLTPTGADGGPTGFNWELTPRLASPVASHALLTGVASMHGDVGARLSFLPSAAAAWSVIMRGSSNEPLMAVRNYGSGKIVLWWAQRSFRNPGPTGNTYESDIGRANNSRFIQNLAVWARNGSPPPPATGLCSASLNFDNAQLPSGWYPETVRGGPGLVNNRLEGQPVDGGGYVHHDGPIQPGASEITFEYRASHSYTFWGQYHSVTLTSSDGTEFQMMDENSAAGAPNQLSLRVDINGAIHQRQFYPFTFGIYRIRQTMRDGSVTLLATRESDGATFGPATLSAPGLRLRDVVRTSVFSYTTSDSGTWVDDLTISCR